MENEIGRRVFLKGAAAAAAGTFGMEEEILLSHLGQPGENPGLPDSALTPMPKGKIKDISISRLICGGNLIGGWAHSRDLLYVSQLFKSYNTDDKILETLHLCEQYGINTILTNPVSGDIINRYWNEKGGKIQWISEVHPKPGDYKTGVRAAIDRGASMAYIQGAVGDRLVSDGDLELVAETVHFIQACGLPAGVGGHALEVITACEEAGISPDFYVKTLHSEEYWSARKPDQTDEVIRNPHDNFWCVDPAATIEYMKGVKKPWIAFKVLAAGAIPPEKGFSYAFGNGADFICVGMFDFQISRDADIAIAAATGTNRARPWQA
ncbi:MAG: hypothetical protein BWX80_00115 [Candidatus Hydrogenedentes bacterium ADurb.Bin101]|mgnify:CR=1 FL=1|jgi:hypothetical protein|nr:MAG: hypothetical protein BWX80_00115 [Candidatus Hydrogenedentes bacterium ADurb.Bin101]HOC69327.1 hypothetical protein [Candidatus Hydrogenedentota bacterium]